MGPLDKLSPEKPIRVVTEGLKNLAPEHHVPIVAIAASDTEGLKNERVGFQDLWGASSVQYAPDVAVMLNRGEGNEIVLSVEKNRMGAANENLGYQWQDSILSGLPSVVKNGNEFSSSYCKSIKKVL